MTTATTDQLGRMLQALSRVLGLHIAPADFDAGRAIAAFDTGMRLQEGRVAGGRPAIAVMQHTEVVMAHCPESDWLAVFECTAALDVLEAACPEKVTEAVVLECLPRFRPDVFKYVPASGPETTGERRMTEDFPRWRTLAMRANLLGEGAVVRAYQRHDAYTRLVPQSVLFERQDEALQFLLEYSGRNEGLLSAANPCFGA